MVRAPEYVLFLLEGSYPDLPAPSDLLRRWFGPRPLSLEELGRQFEQVAGDPRVRGVVLRLQSPRLSPAQVETLRAQVDGLRASGKRVIAWATGYDTAGYLVASAADEILLMPGGRIGPLGLRQEYLFLADALEAVGLKGDFVQISPYKTASDSLTRTGFSDEAREMANWIADSRYRELVEAIQRGRRVDEGQARALVDETPLTDQAALSLGAVDGLVHEEGLPGRLGTGGGPATVLPWDDARRRLLRPPLPRPGRYVARIRIEGVIVDGWSRRPPARLPLPILGEPQTGDLTVVQQARRVLDDRRAAALIVHVNSGGGSATASEAIAAALEQVAARKPVVAVMGDVAASGGYYVTTPARWVVARPSTLTGSIGVLAGKVVDTGLTRKLRGHREVVSRGKNVDLFHPDRPFDDRGRTWVLESIRRTYDLFLERVASARGMSVEEVDRIGGGRVWTGRQAGERGLVDEMGGTREAVAKALDLAGIRTRLPVRDVPEGRRVMAPATAGASPEGFAAILGHLTGARRLFEGSPLCLSPILWWRRPEWFD